MKKILNESQKRAVILEREKAIIENFAKTFNKIKRIDENEMQHLGSHGHNPHQVAPKNIEDYLREIDGMSKYEAIEYLGLQGLSSSQSMRVLSMLDTSIEDDFNDYSDYESMDNKSTNTIDRFSNDDLYENNKTIKK